MLRGRTASSGLGGKPLTTVMPAAIAAMIELRPQDFTFQSYPKALMAALREEHTLMRVFFVTPTDGNTRAQWMMLFAHTHCAAITIPPNAFNRTSRAAGARSLRLVARHRSSRVLQRC